MENWFVPSVASSLPPARSVLVVAPHPDDEVFGCGGCAALYARAGASVLPFIVTDGGAYLAGGQRQATLDTRQTESRNAAAALGTAAPVFGTWADRHLSSAHDLPARLEELIESSSADIVFAPSLWEVHPDHRAAGWAAVTALQGRAAAGAKVPVLAFYEIGAPLRPTDLIDITDVLEAKKQAMACFGSQMAQQRYDVHINALNTFRTYTLPPSVVAAEALIIVLPRDLQAFADNYGEGSTPGLTAVTEAALQRADESMEALHVHQVGLVQELDALGETTRQLREETANLTNQLAEAREEVADLTSRLQNRERELKETQGSVQALLDSHSWRVTRPLRWVLRRLRGVSAG